MRHRAAEARAEGLVRGVVEMVWPRKNSTLCATSAACESAIVSFVQVGRKLQVLHLAADAAGQAADAQVAEAGVDVGSFSDI
jgi:hypothetical protein